MKNIKQINALVSLLDDPDVKIYKQVKKQLLELGKECIPQLENANFENELNSIVKNRIKDLTHTIKLKDLLISHKKWIQHPINLIDGAIQLDQYFFPNITYSFIQKEILEIVNEVSKGFHEKMTHLEKVKVINDVLFDDYKFQGDKRNYHSPENSSLGKLLQNKKGNPLSISILYIEIARQLNLPIMGINLPNHFIVGYLKDKKTIIDNHNYQIDDVLFYINPFSQGVVLKKKDIKDFIHQINIIENKYYFTPCPYTHITKRILNNLNFSYNSSNDLKLKNDVNDILNIYNR